MSNFSEQVHISIGSFTQNVVYHDLELSQKMADHHHFSFVWQYTGLAVIDPSVQSKAIRSYLGDEVIFTFKSLTGIKLMSKGIITELSSVELHGSAVGLLVKGISHTIVLDDMKKSRTFLQRGMDDIVLGILAEGPGEFYQREAIKSTYLQEFKYMAQYNETSFEFLKNPKLITENEKYMFEKDYTKDMLLDDFVISKDLREQLRLHGFPPPEVYESYREKYFWKPKVILPQGCRINSLSIKMCNGEMENPFDKPIEQKRRAIPHVFEIFWNIGSGKNQQEFISKIAFTNDLEYWEKSHFDNGFNGIPVDFDKNQIRTLFKEHIDSNKNTELVIKIDPMKENNRDWSVQIFLEQSGKKYIINQIDHNSGIYD